jgi:hypothetical protein
MSFENNAYPSYSTDLGFLSADQKKTIREALQRGATEQQVVKWLQLARKKQFGAKGAVAAAGRARVPQALGTNDELSVIREVVEQEVRAYRLYITNEFRSLSDWVQTNFADPTRVITNNLEYYFAMRPVYYNAGFDNPAETVFRQLRPFKIFGKEIGGGLHEKYVQKLADLNKFMNMSIELENVGGFVPRPIAGSSELSNHAFGLAIDFVPESNPRLINRDVILTLNSIVREACHSNFDFASDLFKAFNVSPGAEAAAEHINRQATEASTAVQRWLQRNLPIFDGLVSKVDAGKKAAAGSPARVEGDAAEKQIQNDEDMQRVKLLKRFVKPEELRVWAKDGIYTIPLSVMRAFKQMGFKSGEEYEQSKDAMHFELEHRVVLEHGRRRTLEELPGFTVAVIGECLESALQPALNMPIPRF